MASTKSLTAGIITRRTKSMFVMTAVLMSSFLVLAANQPNAPTSSTPPPTATILSPFAVLEPSTKNSPNDKDGFPPSQSSADPEEAFLLGQLTVVDKIYDLNVTLTAHMKDSIPDLTVDNDNNRNIDLLDGKNDGALATGTYYVYWNLNKTGYVPVNTPPGSAYNGSNSASISVVDDVDDFQLTLTYSESSGGSKKEVTSALYPITMWKSASIGQNDLEWISTEPKVVFANLTDSFNIRGKYKQSSAQGLEWMIIQSYYNGRVLRLNRVSLYYYNNHDPGSVKDGVPSGWDNHWVNQQQFSGANLGDTDNRDFWVTEYNYTVIGSGSSDIVPYIQTKKGGDTWKIDTGYTGFNSHVPGGVNPAILAISKFFSPTYPGGVVSGPNPPVIGETTTYSIDIKVENKGGDTAVNVFVYDTVQLGNVVWTGVYTVSQGSLTFDPVSGKIAWNVGTLNRLASATLRYQVAFTPTEAQLGQEVLLNAGATTTGKSLSSGATITAGPTEPLKTLPCTGTADMEITKTANQDTADPGDEITYTLHYYNQGTIAAYNVVVKDTIPDHVSYVSSSPICTFASGVCTWNVGTVAAGGSGDLTITVKVDAGVPDGTILTNIGRVEYTNGGGTPQPPDEDEVDIPVTAPVMEFSKTVDVATADPGDYITYTLNYKNSGTGKATDVVIVDTLPNHVTFVSSTPPPTSSSPPEYTYNIGDVDAGASGTITIIVQVDVGTPDGTVLTNLGTIDYDDDNGNPYVPDEDDTTTTVTAPVVTFDKDVDKTSANPGDVITYTLTATNSGTGVATGIVIKDTIPSATTYVSATPAYSGASGKTYWWNQSTLNAGATFTITLKVSVNPFTGDGVVLTNTAIFNHKDANGNPYPPQSDSTTTTVTAPVVSFDKSVDKSDATPGDQITYTITYSNTGSGKATEVEIVDTLPVDVVFMSSNPPYTSHVDNVYQWDIGTLNAGASGTITIVVKVKTGTPDQTILVNVATMDYADANGNDYDQKEDSASTTVHAPMMEFTKTADVSTADPGDMITYTLHYKNTGTGQATNVVIKDTIPAHTTYYSSTPAYSSSYGSTYVWNIGTVGSGVEGDVILVVTVDAGTADKTQLVNTATLDYKDANGNSRPQLSDDATVTVTAPVMFFDKTADVAFADPGDTILYTLYYHNTGSGLAKNVVIKDTLPSHVTFFDSDPDYTYVSGSTYTFEIGDVTAGADGNIKIWVTVDAGTADQTPLSNYATLDLTDANGNALDQLDDTATTTVTAPVFTFDKSADVAYADPGDIITYTLSYENTGTGDATGAVVKDTIPLYTTVVYENPPSTSHSGRTYEWALGTVGAGVSGSIILKVKVDVGTVDKTVLTNEATLDYDDANGNPYQQMSDSASTTVTAPVVTFDKTANVDEADPGDTVIYTLSYKNLGTGTATLVVIVDTLPSQMTFVTATPYPDDVSGNVLTWDVGTLSPGASLSIVIEAKVKPGTVDGFVLHNAATLDYADANGNYYEQLTDEYDVETTAPVMSFTKVADVTTADPGDTITYTLYYANGGSGVASGVVIVDTLPDDVTFVDASPYPTDISGNVLTWDIGQVGPYTSEEITIIVTVNPYTGDGEFLVNKATMDYNDANGNPYDQKYYEAQVTVTAPILHVSKVADVKKADPGDLIVYTIEYYNSGSGAATGVVIVDTIPEHVTFVDSTPPADSNVGRVYTWNVGVVDAGGSGEITITVMVDYDADDATILHNTVTLDYADANGNGYDQLSDDADVTVTAPVVALEKTSDVSEADPGDTITYTIVFTNSGGGNAKDVFIIDTLPLGLTFVTCTPDPFDVVGRTYTWYWALVGPGESVEVEIMVTVDAYLPDQTLLHNYATGDYDGDNGNPYPQEEAYADVTVTAPVFTFSKTADQTMVDPGDYIVYTLSYENTGTGWASGVKVVDTLSAHVAFVTSVPDPSSVIGNVYTWDIGDVGPGDSGSIVITVKVLAGVPDKTIIHNAATFDYDDANGNAYPQMSDYADCTVTAPVVGMEKTGDVTQADPGDYITYTIYYMNDGSGWASNVIVQDFLPDHSSFFDATPYPDDISGNVLTWQIGSLGPGVSGSIEVIVTVDPGTADKTLLHNVATLDYTDSNGNPYPQRSDYFDVRVTAPVMTITKTADVSEADPGDFVVYTIFYENTGSGDASGVVVVDTLPPEVMYVTASPLPDSIVGQVLTWNVGVVEAMSSDSIQVTAQVKPGTGDQTNVHNDVYMDYSDANGNYIDRVESHTDFVVTAPVMTLEKEAGDVTVSAYVLVNLTLRIAGEKWHDVVLSFIVDGEFVDAASITRYPGSPNDQMVTLYSVKIDVLQPFPVVVRYTPLTDPINGQIWGDNPCWLIVTFQDGHTVRLKHNFNVKHEDTWIWTVDDFRPYVKDEDITFEAHIPYTITYENIGTGDASNVIVVDTFPLGSVFVDSIPTGPTCVLNVCTWLIGDVPAGAIWYIYANINYVFEVDGTVVRNDVTLDYSDANGNYIEQLSAYAYAILVKPTLSSAPPEQALMFDPSDQASLKSDHSDDAVCSGTPVAIQQTPIEPVIQIQSIPVTRLDPAVSTAVALAVAIAQTELTQEETVRTVAAVEPGIGISTHSASVEPVVTVMTYVEHTSAPAVTVHALIDAPSTGQPVVEVLTNALASQDLTEGMTVLTATVSIVRKSL